MPAETNRTDENNPPPAIQEAPGAGSALAGALPKWDLLPEAHLVRRR